jgi:alternate signal-mediated exported protein
LDRRGITASRRDIQSFYRTHSNGPPMTVGHLASLGASSSMTLVAPSLTYLLGGNMNKLVKAAIAGAAGVALLLGGAGTLASWNDSENITGGTITAGTLTIAPVANSSNGWSNGLGAIDIASYRIVPGDQLTYTSTFTVTAQGDRLTADVTLDALSITPDDALDPADVALAGTLTKSAAFTIDGVTTSTITVSEGTQTVVVTATISFPNGAAGAENATKTGAVDLANFAISVSQGALAL